ncbi:NERD domain-containing protein [Bacillus timonensis]|nr:NERD domain-containing protein [Bacillus timonensis]
MIKKERDIPLKLRKLEALQRRLPKTHIKREEVDTQFARSKAGYLGEQSIDYHLDFLDKDYLILHDLRLFLDPHYMQIDTLILTPSFFLILEVKNFSGTLLFDQSFEQLIRLSEDREEAFPNPLLQVSRQQSQLGLWLKKHRIVEDIPVEGFVVIASPYTILKSDARHGGEAVRKVIHSEKLVKKVGVLEKRYRDERFCKKDLRKIANLMVKKHERANPDVLAQFGIGRDEILSGVRCSRCGRLGMERGFGRWICPKCGADSKDAHLEALQDYSFLIAEEISNREARAFLQIESESVARKLLVSMGLEVRGSNRDRSYNLSRL